MYDVASITYPWLGGEGFMCGRAAIKLRLGKTSKSRNTSAHAIAQKIHSIAPMNSKNTPRWVAIIGDVNQADNHLRLVLGSTIDKLVYIEHGPSSMCDPSGILPIWDHVCLRTKLPANPEKIQIFHSVIVEGGATPGQIEEFNLKLEKIGYNGERYIQDNKRARSLLRKQAREWRLTAPVGIA